AFVGARYHATAAAIVEQRVDRLLEHALLVAHDDVGRLELNKPLEAVVAVYHATIKIIEVGRREAPAIERYQRPQLRRDHRHDRHDHPLRPIAGVDEGLHDLEPLDHLLGLLAAVGGGDIGTQR